MCRISHALKIIAKQLRVPNRFRTRNATSASVHFRYNNSAVPVNNLTNVTFENVRTSHAAQLRNYAYRTVDYYNTLSTAVYNWLEITTSKSITLIYSIARQKQC